MTTPPRLLRTEPVEFFQGQITVVAVLDQITNVVHFNEIYAGDRVLERRALFMQENIYHLPPGHYLAK